MRYSELEKELKKAGCKVYREGANHSIWYSPVTGQKSGEPPQNGGDPGGNTEIHTQSGGAGISPTAPVETIGT